MKQLTIKDIRNLEPCYDPTKYLPEDWTGTAIDILKMTDIPVDDRLWVAVRGHFVPDKVLQLFALTCARQCEKYSTDERVKKCNDVTDAYLKGEATKKELDVATAYAVSAAAYATSATTFAYSSRAAFPAATCAATTSAAASYSASRAAHAAYSASYAAAIAYAFALSTYSTRDDYATDAATYSASYYAARAAYDVARDIAQEEQRLILIKLIEENEI